MFCKPMGNAFLFVCLISCFFLIQQYIHSLVHVSCVLLRVTLDPLATLSTSQESGISFVWDVSPSHRYDYDAVN